MKVVVFGYEKMGKNEEYLQIESEAERVKKVSNKGLLFFHKEVVLLVGTPINDSQVPSPSGKHLFDMYMGMKWNNCEVDGFLWNIWSSDEWSWGCDTSFKTITYPQNCWNGSSRSEWRYEKSYEMRLVRSRYQGRVKTSTDETFQC